jgi:hypothetical protein
LWTSFERHTTLDGFLHSNQGISQPRRITLQLEKRKKKKELGHGAGSIPNEFQFSSPEGNDFKVMVDASVPANRATFARKFPKRSKKIFK